MKRDRKKLGSGQIFSIHTTCCKRSDSILGESVDQIQLQCDLCIVIEFDFVRGIRLHGERSIVRDPRKVRLFAVLYY